MRSILFFLILTVGNLSMAANAPISCNLEIKGEVTIDQMVDVYSRCAPIVSSQDFRKSQFVHFDGFQMIESGPDKFVAQAYQEIKDIFPFGGNLLFRVFQQENLLQNGQWQMTSKQFDVEIQPFSMKTLKMMSGETKFYNLTAETGVMPIPTAVFNQPDCGGMKDCRSGLRTFRMSFTKLYWKSPNAIPQKYTTDITFSPDAPTFLVNGEDPNMAYASKQVSTCGTSDENSNQPVITSCYHLTNFHF